MNTRPLEEIYSFQFYKKRIIFLIVISASPYMLHAQKDSIKNKNHFPPKSEGFYDIVYIKTEVLAFTNNKNNVSASFPYQSNDINTGLIKNDTFNIASSTPFIKPLIFIGIAFEFNKYKNCINTQILAPINYFSSGSFGSSISLGYGRAIDYSIRNKKITIKPFLNFFSILS